jgi:hypothetical protein
MPEQPVYVASTVATVRPPGLALKVSRMAAPLSTVQWRYRRFRLFHAPRLSHCPMVDKY